MGLSIFYRYTVFALCVLFTLATLPIHTGHLPGLPFGIYLPRLELLTLLTAALSLLGIYDLVQTRHAVRRNYPVIGNIRYLVESVRPEIRQYLLEGDHEALPFSRAQRSMVYARAKEQNSDKAFGTLVDVYKHGYEFMTHAMIPAAHADPDTFRVRVGGPACTQPYEASVFNVSAMSFGSLSANAIRALNKGAKLGGFYHDTGEGSISPYHLEYGADLVWEIGSGYFGCRNEDGTFNPQRFTEQSRRPEVKMIEIKLSQGAKPGHGGILPKHKISEEISATRGIPMGKDCISPATHSAFSTPVELLQFIAQLREMSGGKPVGFKLCIGHPWEFTAIAKAMLKTGIMPDFIVVDGGEGGTGAAPSEFSDHLGVPLREALLFVHNTLVGIDVRQHIRLGASGKIISAFDIARALAIGADWTNSARGFMMAIGCIQSQTCHTNQCPTGVATQDPLRQRALVVADKGDRVYNFHHNTMHALAEFIAAAGLKHPSELTPRHLAKRISDTEVRNYLQLQVYLKPGELLDGKIQYEFYQYMWDLAQAETFDENPNAVRRVEPPMPM
jgi:glutamate synthase domain-containing protein 2